MKLNQLVIGQEIAGRLGTYIDNKKVFEQDVIVQGVIYRVTRFAIFFTRKDGSQGKAFRKNFKGGIVKLVNPDGSNELINC